MEEDDMPDDYERTARGEETSAGVAAGYEEVGFESPTGEYRSDAPTTSLVESNPPYSESGTTSSYGAGSADTGSSGSGSATDVAKDQAQQVGEQALQSGQHVASVAADELKTVASEAGTEAKDLLSEARSQFTEQLSAQQHNLGTWVRDLAQEFEAMVDRSDNSQASAGPATALARQASGRAHSVASWLEHREPQDVLQEVQRFARRRPGSFLAIAAVGGLLAGRLTRGLTSEDSNDDSTSGANSEKGSTDPATLSSTTPAYPATGATGAWADPTEEYNGGSSPTGHAGEDRPLAARNDQSWAPDEGPTHEVARSLDQNQR